MGEEQPICERCQGGKETESGEDKGYLQVEAEVGAKCHRSVKAIICSCSLL